MDKTYYVLKVYKIMNPSIIFTTKSAENAIAYKNIMSEEYPDDTFEVAATL